MSYITEDILVGLRVTNRARPAAGAKVPKIARNSPRSTAVPSARKNDDALVANHESVAMYSRGTALVTSAVRSVTKSSSNNINLRVVCMRRFFIYFSKF